MADDLNAYQLARWDSTTSEREMADFRANPAGVHCTLRDAVMEAIMVALTRGRLERFQVLNAHDAHGLIRRSSGLLVDEALDELVRRGLIVQEGSTASYLYYSLRPPVAVQS